MTEAEAIAGLDTDAAAAQTLTATITGDYDAFDAVADDLEAQLASLSTRLQSMELNVNYAITSFMPSPSE